VPLRAPELFVYSPCPPETEAFLEELSKRGAWDMVRYCLRRAEMVMDQLSVLLSLNAKEVLEVIGQSLGPNAAVTQRKLPQRLLQLIHAASTDMGASQTKGVDPEVRTICQ
jgi:hypothetical protein